MQSGAKWAESLLRRDLSHLVERIRGITGRAVVHVKGHAVAATRMHGLCVWVKPVR
jgi:hypothetical protein